MLRLGMLGWLYWRTLLQLIVNIFSAVDLDIFGSLRLVGVRINAILAILLDKCGEILNSTATRVEDWSVLLSGNEELDGREALDVIWNIVGGGIDLGNDNLVAEWLEELTELVVLGRESLAVSAPWGIELNQDILLLIENNVLVVVGNDNGDWAILRLWNRLALDAGLDAAGDELVNESSDGLGSDFLGLVKGILFVLDGVLDGKGRPLANLEIEVTGVLAKGLGIDCSKVDLGAVLLGNGLQLLGEGSAFFFGFSEDVGERNTGLRVVRKADAA
jgi:hypothetical protein